MAGSKINDYNIGDSNIQSVMLTLDKAYKGLHQVSLTNYNTTSESQIAAGSVVENNGALYQFTSNESITGTPADGTVYIRLVPNGDTITAEYTNTAPTWSDSKQGWYGTGGDANKRYLEFSLVKNSSSWLYKFTINQKFLNSYIDFQGSKNVAAGTVVYTQVDFTSKAVDLLSELSLSSHSITIAQDGVYSISIYFQGEAAAQTMQVDLRVDGITVHKAGFGPITWYVGHIAANLYLKKNQVLTLWANHTISSNPRLVQMKGEMVKIK